MRLPPCRAPHPHSDRGVRLGSLSLIPFSYAAQDLLERTVVSFYQLRVDELTSAQERALIRFDSNLHCFENFFRIEYPHDHRIDGHVFCLMKCLDRLFFFGTLTENGPPIVTLKLITEDALEGERRPIGLHYPEDPVNGVPQSTIEIAIGATELIPIHYLVEVLVHEMIHAYLDSFICRGSQCLRDRRNTIGIMSSQHGPTFRALQYATLTTLPGLSSSYRQYIELHGMYNIPQRYELREEQRASEEHKVWITINGLRPLRGPSPDDCIRVNGADVVIEAERLREKLRGGAGRHMAV